MSQAAGSKWARAERGPIKVKATYFDPWGGACESVSQCSREQFDNLFGSQLNGSATATEMRMSLATTKRPDEWRKPGEDGLPTGVDDRTMRVEQNFGLRGEVMEEMYQLGHSLDRVKKADDFHEKGQGANKFASVILNNNPGHGPKGFVLVYSLVEDNGENEYFLGSFGPAVIADGNMHHVCERVHFKDGSFEIEYPDDKAEEVKLQDLLFRDSAPYTHMWPSQKKDRRQKNIEKSESALLAPFKDFKGRPGLIFLYHGLSKRMADVEDLTGWASQYPQWYFPPSAGSQLCCFKELPVLKLDDEPVIWANHVFEQEFKACKDRAGRRELELLEEVMEIDLGKDKKGNPCSAKMRGVMRDSPTKGTHMHLWRRNEPLSTKLAADEPLSTKLAANEYKIGTYLAKGGRIRAGEPFEFLRQRASAVFELIRAGSMTATSKQKKEACYLRLKEACGGVEFMGREEFQKVPKAQLYDLLGCASIFLVTSDAFTWGDSKEDFENTEFYKSAVQKIYAKQLEWNSRQVCCRREDKADLQPAPERHEEQQQAPAGPPASHRQLRSKAKQIESPKTPPAKRPQDATPPPEATRPKKRRIGNTKKEDLIRMLQKRDAEIVKLKEDLRSSVQVGDEVDVHWPEENDGAGKCFKGKIVGIDYIKATVAYEDDDPPEGKADIHVSKGGRWVNADPPDSLDPPGTEPIDTGANIPTESPAVPLD